MSRPWLLYLVALVLGAFALGYCDRTSRQDEREARELAAADSTAAAWRAVYAPLRARAKALSAPAAAAVKRSDAIRPVATRDRDSASAALGRVTVVLKADTSQAVKDDLAKLTAGLERWKQQAMTDSITLAILRVKVAADSLAAAAADSTIIAERSRANKYRLAYQRQRRPWRLGLGVAFAPTKCADATVGQVCPVVFAGYTRPIPLPWPFKR